MDDSSIFAAFMVVGVIALIYLLMLLAILAVSIAFYVLYSLGLYNVSKRRGISNPIFAWIPLLNVWLLGSIADDYDLKTKGVNKKSRIILTVLSVIGLFAGTIGGVLLVVVEFSVLNALTAESESAIIAASAGYLIIILVLMGLGIATSVFRYIALYKFYKSCKPDMAVVFLILSIFVSMSMPILVFICRNEDAGLIQTQ